jgi:ethanolamine utilization cobalamin adenosyltransferase
VTSLLKGETTLVVNNITGENKIFISLRKAAEFLGINQSYIAKSIKNPKFYFGRDYLVYKSLTNLEEIVKLIKELQKTTHLKLTLVILKHLKN